MPSDGNRARTTFRQQRLQNYKDRLEIDGEYYIYLLIEALKQSEIITVVKHCGGILSISAQR